MSPETVQGVATLLGIAGTFTGIIYALYGLDINDVGASIPKLLNGIYPAFVSSLFGVLVSLLVYLFPRFWKRDEVSRENDQDTESQILLELKTLNESFTGFSEKIADNNMKGLEKVIKEFNEKLQDQFGENFKQLNEAVGKLLVWQEHYQKTLEDTKDSLDSVVQSLESSKESMTVSTNAMKEIADSSRSIVESSDNLKELLAKTKEVVDGIGSFTKDIDSGGLEAITARVLENFGKNLVGISNRLVQDYREVQKAMERIVEIKGDLDRER